MYDPDSDSYVPIKVWQNKNDPSDFIVAATLAGRTRREELYKELVAECEIKVDYKGNCQRDATAVRKNFTAHRPGLPMLYLDGTGASLGKGLLNAELGCADFVGTCKQSRAVMQPLAAAEGNDHSI
eukprot:6207960-Pleurochrysis_carterae.AAC.2